ncbi:Acyltransferase family protein [compost metagenome]
MLDGSLLAVVTANTFLIQTWGIASYIARPAWSLSAEWAAYLLFPLFAAILIHGRRAFAVAGAVACLAAIIVVSLSESSFVLGSQAHRSGTLDLHSFDSPAPMVRCIAGFGLGLVAYRLREVGIVQSLLGNKRISHSVCAAVLVMLCIPRSDIAVVVLFPALIISLSFQRGLLARVLSSNAIFAIGVWSYSIYLLHRPFFIMQDAIAERLAAYSLSSAEGLATLLTIIVVITLSAIAYNLIENPGRGFINRLFGYSTRNATAPDKPGL